MEDLFENTVLCKNCQTKMKQAKIIRSGFELRALVCDKCENKIVHPQDEAEYNQFLNLRNKEFRVKLRLVGNSYAVSIPKEVVDFMKEQEKMFDDMVRLCFHDAKRINLMFGEEHE
ncbi:hypothetical protein HYW76_00255 [Candidatus Pacearchaeota archaeon]|nr:hypothetical protein [Candidatus Pacearchaeota archaeon]